VATGLWMMSSAEYHLHAQLLQLSHLFQTSHVYYSLPCRADAQKILFLAAPTKTIVQDPISSRTLSWAIRLEDWPAERWCIRSDKTFRNNRCALDLRRKRL